MSYKLSDLIKEFSEGLSDHLGTQHRDHTVVVSGSSVTMLLKRFGDIKDSKVIQRKVTDLDFVILPKYSISGLSVERQQQQALNTAYNDFIEVAKKLGFEIKESVPNYLRPDKGAINLLLEKQGVELDIHVIAEFVNYIPSVQSSKLKNLEFINPKTVFATKLGRLIGGVFANADGVEKPTDIIDMANILENGAAGVLRHDYEVLGDEETIKEIKLITLMTIGSIINENVDKIDFKKLEPTEENTQDLCQRLRGHINDDPQTSLSKDFTRKLLKLTNSIVNRFFPDGKFSEIEKEFFELMTNPQIPVTSGFKPDTIDKMVDRVIATLKKEYGDVFSKYPDLEKNIRISPSIRLNANTHIDLAELG